MNIEEVIVVEGKSDTVAVRRATGADTIETNGSAVSDKTIERIRHAQQTRGVIVFTDPDFPGRRIRAIVEEQVPGVKHAFLTKKETIAKNGHGLGIEHASDDAIRRALASVYTVSEHTIEEIPMAVLLEAQLIGHEDSRKRRERLSELLHIGQVNGKGLKKRLEMFRISNAQLNEAIRIVDGEGMNTDV
ncbi:ribonuclease M5 [Sporosarcina sp. P37]|uniref:ribonuclease M5 n=1 Tax=unclassified Sporosarcina TaxID=2647733 RepID=UPI000A17F198|nr:MULTISPECIES: ribonuclease M5 [unclassified Sporosarcina]ARK26264.1 ribonuclease M5 [Sporosarcina sp. P37]PID18086.1 ribonuclease M5 [Sporosarcina sp. P35]